MVLEPLVATLALISFAARRRLACADSKLCGSPDFEPAALPKNLGVVDPG
jgi:hypothetical protein